MKKAVPWPEDRSKGCAAGPALMVTEVLGSLGGC